MDAPQEQVYRQADPNQAPDIGRTLRLDTPDGHEAARAFGGGCLGVEVVRSGPLHAVAIFGAGAALELLR